MSTENSIISNGLTKLNNTIESVGNRIILEESISSDMYSIAQGLYYDSY